MNEFESLKNITLIDDCTVDILNDMYNTQNDAFVLVINITKDIVNTKHYDYMKSFIDSINLFDKRDECKFVLNFAGYDSDKREVYEIQEIKDYITTILSYDKTFLEYMVDESLQLIIIIYSYENNIATDNGASQNVGIDIRKTNELLINSSLDMIEKYNDPHKGLDFLNRVNRVINYNVDTLKNTIKKHFNI